MNMNQHMPGRWNKEDYITAWKARYPDDPCPWLCAPDGKHIVGMCRTDADIVIKEYQEKLGETWHFLEIEGKKLTMAHDHDYQMSRYCGVKVCSECDEHKGLDRCYCGWSRSGGDGYRELTEMGETIEEDT